MKGSYTHLRKLPETLDTTSNEYSRGASSVEMCWSRRQGPAGAHMHRDA